MSPVTHFFTGWVLANSASFSRKERARAPVAPLLQVDGAVSLWRYPWYEAENAPTSIRSSARGLCG
jgi:hypothetical protein